MHLKKKKILLLTTENYQLHIPIEKNLIANGFDVVTVLRSDVQFRYKNKWEHLKVKLKGTFGNDKGYINKYKLKVLVHSFIHKLEVLEHFDYCLVLRSDFFPIEVLQYVKSKCTFMVSYHYDGLKRDPAVLDRIALFDKFYVFDQADVISNEHYTTYLSNNFYFDYDNPVVETNFDVYFLGYYAKSRERFLFDFFKIAKEILGRPHFDIVFLPNQLTEMAEYEKRGINCLTNIIPFEDYLKKIEQTNIIADFLISEHNGLSFRIFEGLKYGKKVITTNASVKNYDFYNSNNFFVLTIDNLDIESITQFLQSPYVPIDKRISLKYSFTSWITTILDLH